MKRLMLCQKIPGEKRLQLFIPATMFTVIVCLKERNYVPEKLTRYIKI